MSEHYLLLPRLDVQTANAQAAWWLINAAPIMAANLFAHNLGRQTGVFPRRVGIVHHDAQFLGEFFYGKYKSQQRRGAVYIDKEDYSSKNRHALSLQPTATCHLSLSLVLAFDGLESLPPLSKVRDFLAGARLAGGQVIGHGEPRTAADLSDLRKAIPTGYWLVERPDLMVPPDSAGDPLDALIGACSRPRRKRSEAAEDSRANPESWVVPTTLGYALITEAVERTGARGGYPHAYAEPLVGLVQYVSMRDLADRAFPFWRMAWPSNDVFLITQTEG